MTRPPTAHRSFPVAATAALVAAVVLAVAAVWVRPHVTVSGLSDGDVVTPSVLGALLIAAHGDVDRVEVQLDGAAVPVHRDGDRIALAAPHLAEGRHTLLVRSPDAVLPLPGDDVHLDFTVDATPPAIAVDPVRAADLDAPVELRGRATGASTLLVDAEPWPLAEDGAFAVTVPPDATTVDLEARDAAGNTVFRRVPVAVRHPGMRAVHMSAQAWSAASLREPVLQLAREGRIDTVQLDIKDESGEIGYASRVPLANEIGAGKDYYDVRVALDELHAAGLRVVGRVVAFRDPILGRASWQSGHPERLVQNADGTPYSGGYGQYSFTNFANPDVRAYNIAVAAEAAELGFDEILYDYVRRPDGAVSGMRFEGLTTTPEQSIADFLAETMPAVREHGSLLGASVFGIAATRPTQIGQDIPAIAPHVDYVAPMVYPSHWGPGEYGVANPEGQPYDITTRSLADFAALTEGTTAVVPWLQAFSLRHAYGPAEVRAQIEAAEAAGITSFLLWDPNCRYPAAALDPAPQG
jgi:hypothetical protein